MDLILSCIDAPMNQVQAIIFFFKVGTRVKPFLKVKF